MAKKALQAEQQALKDLEDQAAARLRPWSHHICLYNSIYVHGDIFMYMPDSC